MTRQEQLVFCKRCTQRKMDLKSGLLCGITDAKATFEESCTNFQEDPNALNIVHQTEALSKHALTEQLSTKDFDALKKEQNLGPAILCGAIVGIIGAVLWGFITVVTEFQIGYMAVAIGAGVGYTIRLVGKGISPIFGYCGAAIALFSVLLGNVFSIIGFVANAQHLTIFETLLFFDYTYLPQLLSETFSFMDIFFYGFAIYEGYRFSFRLISQEDLVQVRERSM